MSPLARLTILLLLPMAVAAQLQSQSKPLVMVVQPINSEESTLASYGPLLQMFPSVTRQPTMVMAENSEEAIQLLFSDKVAAAIIPTRLVSDYDGLNVVTTTEQVPSPAFSVSPRVDTETAAALRQALLQLTASEQGQAILASARVPAFEAADNADYEGYHVLLNEVWGYDLAVSAR